MPVAHSLRRRTCLTAGLTEWGSSLEWDGGVQEWVLVFAEGEGERVRPSCSLLRTDMDGEREPSRSLSMSVARAIPILGLNYA